MGLIEQIKQWWREYRAKLPYTRKELEKIHKDVYGMRELFGDVETVTLEATVWDKVVGDYRELRTSSLLALGLILVLELFIMWILFAGVN